MFVQLSGPLLGEMIAKGVELAFLVLAACDGDGTINRGRQATRSVEESKGWLLRVHD